MGFSRARYNNIQRWGELSSGIVVGEVPGMPDEAKWRKGEWSKWLDLEKQLKAELDARRNDPQNDAEWVPALLHTINEMKIIPQGENTEPFEAAKQLVAVNVKKNAIFYLEAMKELALEAEAPEFARITNKYGGMPTGPNYWNRVAKHLDTNEEIRQAEKDFNADEEFYKIFETKFRGIGDKHFFERGDMKFFEDGMFVTDNMQDFLETIEQTKKGRTTFFSNQEKPKPLVPADQEKPNSPTPTDQNDDEFAVYMDILSQNDTKEEIYMAQYYNHSDKTAVDYLVYQFGRDLTAVNDYYTLSKALEKAGANKKLVDFLSRKLEESTYGRNLKGWTKVVDMIAKNEYYGSTPEMAAAIRPILDTDDKVLSFWRMNVGTEWGKDAASLKDAARILRYLLDGHASAVKAGESSNAFDPIAELMAVCVDLYDGGTGKIDVAELKLKRLYARSRHALHTDLGADSYNCDPKVCLTGEYEYSSKR